MTRRSKPNVADSITAYLSGGGLFNPELANHEAVRDLLIDCREAIAEKDSALKACVEALESLFSGQADPDRAKRCSDAIIQSKEALQ